jgi:hypothetical protein
VQSAPALPPGSPRGSDHFGDKSRYQKWSEYNGGRASAGCCVIPTGQAATVEKIQEMENWPIRQLPSKASKPAALGVASPSENYVLLAKTIQ